MKRGTPVQFMVSDEKLYREAKALAVVLGYKLQALWPEIFEKGLKEFVQSHKKGQK